ncbi:MAG: PKD domain-containing protein [Bacteroidetes bacterium]|nr:PKD domain-containing protein [Bacteroidota bacterium]
MKKSILSLLILIGSCMFVLAQNTIQMPLPAQNTTFSGSVRGYWFTSPTCFTITGAQVPFDAATGDQSIAIVKLDSAPPLYSTVTNNFTVLYLTQNNPDTGIQALNIEVAPGDIIGVLGVRKNTSGSDVNSYATSPSTSDINGFPVTIQRLGMQFSLSTTSPQDLWTEAAGSISRVFLYYDTTYSINVYATWQGGTIYSFTNGASSGATSVWDYGDGSPLDTAYNPTHTFPSPGNYTVCSYITGACVSDTVCTTVIICPAPALAAYNYTINYPTVDFSDGSQNAVSWSWDFGDGSPLDNSQNPSHTYSTFGLYTVCLTVTDTCGGVNTKCQNISVCPAVLPISLGSDVTACGSTVLSLPGSYTTYTWSNASTTSQITVTTTGTYNVVVTDAAGCSGGDTIDVTINPNPVVSLGNDSVSICGGLAITLDAQNPGSTYLWNTTEVTQTITVTQSGLYSVTVTNGFGCTAADTITATVFTLPSLFLGFDLNICESLVNIYAGNNGSTYIWNTGATTQTIQVMTGGTYSVLVTDVNGCTAVDTINIVMNPQGVSYVETQSLVCVTASPITLTPGTPAGGTYSGPGVTGNTFDPAVAGVGNKNVIYAYTDTAGCIGRDTSVITVDPCSGIGEINSAGIHLYPNPGTGVFQLTMKDQAALILVMDNQGKEVFRRVPESKQQLLDLSREAEGVYLLMVLDKNNEFSMPFVIAR